MATIAIACAAWACLPVTARAWKYHEHMRIGEQSYRCACVWLRDLAGLPIGGPGQVSDEDRATCGCPPGTTQEKDGSCTAKIELDDTAKNVVRELMCKDTADMARVYGQATGLAGDHLGSFEEFEQIEGQRDTVSLVVYASRAVGDGDHFHPRAPLLWHEHHAKALERGETTYRPKVSAELHRAAFFEMLYINAFGDHFLQDSFAAGHMGFNRGATRPTAAMVYHNKYNYLGRFVRDRRGDAFLVHGDGSLHWAFGGKPKLLWAASVSVFDALLTFATGYKHPEVERQASDRIPVAYASVAQIGEAELEQARMCQGVAPEALQRDDAWVPLKNMHDAAWVTWAPGIEYRHAWSLSSLDYQRDQISLLLSTKLSDSYGLRLDVGGGFTLSPMRDDNSTGGHLRTGVTLPIYAGYSSLLSIDAGLGAFNEACLKRCASTPAGDADRRGQSAGYLTLRFNIEAGNVLLLQAFVEGFVGSDWGGDGLGGMALGLTLGKPVRTSEPSEFSGPPI